MCKNTKLNYSICDLSGIVFIAYIINSEIVNLFGNNHLTFWMILVPRNALLNLHVNSLKI